MEVPGDTSSSRQPEAMAEELMGTANLDAVGPAETQDSPLAMSNLDPVQDTTRVGLQAFNSSVPSSSTIRRDGFHFYGGAGSAYLLVSISCSRLTSIR